MQIIAEKTSYHRYAFTYDFSREKLEFCRYLKELYGWKNFTFFEGKWRFFDPNIIATIKAKYPDVKIDPLIETKQTNEIEEKKEISHNASDSKLSFEGIKGELYSYQKEGVQAFIDSGQKIINADEMGSGKTLQSLAALVVTKKQRSLVICPASVKYGWADEVEKWTYLKSYVVTSQTDFREIPYDTNVVIINYDILKKHFNSLMLVKWDALIVDEFHMIKSNTAQRTKAVKAIARKIMSIILLSGTPLLSRPVELFNGLQMMDPVYWNNWYDFTRKYCEGRKTRWGYEAKGASNIEELQHKIKRYFIRRTKAEVLPFLPKKIFIDYAVDLPNSYVKEYQVAEKEFGKYLAEYKKKKVAAIAKSLQAEKLTKINFLRQITTMGKLDTAEELINNIIESGRKVLVFSSFNEPLMNLHGRFKGSSVVLTGATPIDERPEIIKRFQNDSSVNIFFGGIIASGVGITLTAATVAVFLDYSWNPADHAQAVDRMHRPGATAESVTIYQLYTKGTVDEFMKKILSRKKKIFDALIDGDKIDKTSITEEFLDEIERVYANEPF